MSVVQIVIIVFVILVLLYFIIDAFSKVNTLTKMAEGKKLQTIKADDLKNTNNSTNFTYSMWIYVDDWNYKFGKKKTVLNRNSGPEVVLGDKPNTINVNVAYYSTGSTPVGASTGPNAGNCAANAANAKACEACNQGFSCACANCDPVLYAATYDTSTTPPTLKVLTPPCSDGKAGAAAGAGTPADVAPCLIENIPIQAWVNIVISLYGSTLDTYLNGKLVRTCVLPGVPKIDNNADILVTPDGGFSGWTTAFKFWANASNPQEAYNIYKAGFGGSILGNALNKYRVKFAMVKDNVETGSFEI